MIRFLYRRRPFTTPLRGDLWAGPDPPNYVHGKARYDSYRVGIVLSEGRSFRMVPVGWPPGSPIRPMTRVACRTNAISRSISWTRSAETAARFWVLGVLFLSRWRLALAQDSQTFEVHQPGRAG